MLRPFQALGVIRAILVAVGSAPAHALVQPERMELIKPQAGDGGKVCGIAAEFTVSGGTLRVEVGSVRDQVSAPVVLMRAYAPTSVGPIMRDIWLKTPTLFTLGRFKPARENSNGILEVRGAVDPQEATAVVSEIAAGEVEISIVFDGRMPTARFPVGLPHPLPIDLAGALDECANGQSPR